MVNISKTYRDPATFAFLTGATNTLFDYGFTGHEHLDDFGLINMTGRVYDPALGRFLSPDNPMQNPYNLQNYNRYSYCVNNPLKYSDPDGEIFGLAVAAWLLFTESGYEAQKYVSPVAAHVDVKLGNQQRGLGFDVSVGVPKYIQKIYK